MKGEKTGASVSTALWTYVPLSVSKFNATFLDLVGICETLECKYQDY